MIVPPDPLLLPPPSPVTVKLPVVLVSEMPGTFPPIDETLVRDRVPPVPLRLTAAPAVVVTFTSLVETPDTAPPLSPVDVVVTMLSPRTVLLAASATVLPMVVVGGPAFIAGKLLPLGTVTPAMVASVAVASWPISFWPVRSTVPLEYVYGVALSYAKMFWLLAGCVPTPSFTLVNESSVVKGFVSRPLHSEEQAPALLLTNQII